MVEPVLKTIEELVTVIYDMEQTTLHTHFQKLIDTLSTFLNDMFQAGYSVLLDEELIRLQECYERQDYVEMADLLLYELKPELEQLKEELAE
ncbi:MAG: hypothetical protein RSB37_02760 [Acetivibrio sp.]